MSPVGLSLMRCGNWCSPSRCHPCLYSSGTILRASAIIYGRSDSTINRMGIRMGSSEIYRVVEALPEVLDSLIVGVEFPGGKYYMPLFVVLREHVVLDDALKAKIKESLRRHISPHHVPDDIMAISEVPRTLSGK